MILFVMAKENYCGFITKGKIYKVLDRTQDFYEVLCDSGKGSYLYKRRFIPADCNKCIERKCNSCEVNAAPSFSG